MGILVKIEQDFKNLNMLIVGRHYLHRLVNM